MAFIRNSSEEGGNSVTQDTKEVVDEGKDELGKFLEAAKSSIKTPVVNPQQQAQKAQQDAAKRARVMNFISIFQRDEQLKNQWLMKKEQEKQKKEREEAEQKQIKEIQLKRKDEQMSQAVKNAKRAKETRNKAGGA